MTLGTFFAANAGMRAPSRTFTLPILLFLFALPLQAAPPALSGVVVNEAGVPLAGAEVVAGQKYSLRRSTVSARTDASGRFRIQMEDCGLVVLRASRRDFAPSSMDVDACQTSTDYRIVLRRGATASGRITGADGRPVAGAGVELVRSSAPREPGPRATTGPDGRFIVSGISPGVYVLRTAHPKHPRLEQKGVEIPEGNPKVDLGGFALSKPQKVEGQVVDQEGRPLAGVRILQDRSGPLEISAAPVTGPDGRFVLPEVVFGRLTLCKEGYDSAWGPMISPSRTSQLSRIVLRPAPQPFRVSGRIVDGEGRPVDGARVRSGPHESGCVVITRTDPCTGERIPDDVMVSDMEGRFSVELRERMDFDFRAEAPGYLPTVRSRVPAVPGQSAEIEMVLRRSLAVTGRVLAKGGSPAAGVKVALFMNPSGPQAVTDAQGRFRLEGIAPGRQDFQAEHPKLGRAVRRLEVGPDASSLELRLDGVAERAIAGLVLDPDGKPLPGVPVDVVGGPRAWSDAKGRFRLILDPYEPPYLTTATIRASKDGYASTSQVVALSEGSSPQDVELRLGAGQSISGRLLADPDRLAGASVEARQGEELRQAEVTREGRYRLVGLGPGEWTVTAHAQGGWSDPKRVLLEPGQEEAFLDLEVSRPLALRGRVLEPDGTPSASARVRVSRSGGPGLLSVVSDADGRFAVEVPSGTYAILATQPRYAPARLESVTVAEPLDGLEIRLRPGLPLTGRILGLPAGVHTSVRAEQDGAYRMTEAGPDGTYRFDDLGPGEWKLTARVSGKDFYRDMEESVLLSPETAGARYDFDPALGNASLSGRIEAGDRPVFAEIELLTATGEEVPSTRLGFRDEEYRYSHLRPGTYTLRITDRISRRVLTRTVEVSGDERLAIDPRE